MNGSNRVGKLFLAALMILGFNGLGSFVLIETGSTKTVQEPRVEVSSRVEYPNVSQ